VAEYRLYDNSRSSSKLVVCLLVLLGQPWHHSWFSRDWTSLPSLLTLRWDSSNSAGPILKLTFPLDADTTASKTLARLVSDCQPASFGLNGANILDDTYRKATKLDRNFFSIDFCS
jgi:hypothetical protein